MRKPFITVAMALSVIVIFFYSAAKADDGKAAKKNRELMKTQVIERLQGRWDIIEGVNQGRSLSSGELQGMYMTVKTNVIATYDSKDNARFQAVFELDETKKPIHITLNGLASKKVVPPHLKTTKQLLYDPISHGIIKFDGPDTCLLCYSLPGGETPKKFESPDGSKQMLFKLRRIGTSNPKSLRPEKQSIGPMEPTAPSPKQVNTAARSPEDHSRRQND